VTNIVLIQGHPDGGQAHFCDALLDAYAQGARNSDHLVDRIEVNRLNCAPLQSADHWRASPPPDFVPEAQSRIRKAEHLVIFYPLWLGDMPALLKAFFEQVLRPDFAFSEPKGKLPVKLLKGRSARIVVTMGMPAAAYRWFYRAHSVRSLKRNILNFCGIRPVRVSLVGAVEGAAAQRDKWLDKMARLGQKAR